MSRMVSFCIRRYPPVNIFGVGWRENRSTLVRYLTIEFRVYLDGTDVGVVTLVVVDSRD